MRQPIIRQPGALIGLVAIFVSLIVTLTQPVQAAHLPGHIDVPPANPGAGTNNQAAPGANGNAVPGPNLTDETADEGADVSTVPSVPVNEDPYDCTVNTTRQEDNSNDPGATRVVVRDLLLKVFTYNSLSQRLRCDPLIIGGRAGGDNSPTVSVYQVSQNLVNVAVLFILLFIGFANILRIKLDTYAVKKSIPLLMFGVLMANLGLPIIRTLVDFAGVLSATFISSSSDLGTKQDFVRELVGAVYQGGIDALAKTLNNTGTTGLAEILGIVGITGLAISSTAPFLVIFLVGGLFLVFLPATMMLLLGLLFVARIYVLVILTAVSPIAFASLGFEPLKAKLWSWWWGQFIKWTFMAPATFFMFWLGIQFYHAVGRDMDIGTYIITLFLLYYATQIPLKMGGSVISQWNDKLVKPVGEFLNKPFEESAKFVEKAVPRDTSRFLSSKGLNLVKTVRQAMADIEHKNVEKEGRSPSTRLGQVAAQVLSHYQLANLPKSDEAKGLKAIPYWLSGRARLQEAINYNKERQFGDPNAVAFISQQSEELLRRAGFDPRNLPTRTELETEENKQKLAKLKELTTAASKSSDDLMVGAALRAHAVLGDQEINELIGAYTGRRQMPGLQQLKTLLNRSYQKAAGYSLDTSTAPQAGDQPKGTNPAHDRALDDLTRVLEKDIEMYRHREQKQIEILRNMLNDLKLMTNNFQNLKQGMDGSRQATAMARILAQYADKLNAGEREQVRSMIIPALAQRGEVNIRHFLESSQFGEVLVQAARTAAREAGVDDTPELTPQAIENIFRRLQQNPEAMLFTHEHAGLMQWIENAQGFQQAVVDYISRQQNIPEAARRALVTQIEAVPAQDLTSLRNALTINRLNDVSLSTAQKQTVEGLLETPRQIITGLEAVRARENQATAERAAATVGGNTGPTQTPGGPVQS